MLQQLLHNRRFALFWGASLTITLGVELYNVAVVVTIFERNASAVETAGVFAARMLPTILLGPIAGTLIDHFSWRRMLLLLNGLRLSLLLVAFFFASQTVWAVWQIYILVIGLAVLEAFYLPTQLSLLPLLVGRDNLVRANSLVMTTNHLVFVLAYALAGLVVVIGLPGMILLDLLVFAVGAGLIWLLGEVEPQRDAIPFAPRLFVQEVRAGLHYLRSDGMVRALVTMEYLEYWPHGAWTAPIMLAYTERVLHAGADVFGWQIALFFTGQLAGGLLALVVVRWLSHWSGRVIIVNSLLNALLSMAYALNQSIVGALIINLSFGPPTAMRDILQDSLLQSHVTPTMMGRIYAMRQTLVNSHYTAASFVFAWLADLISLPAVFLLTATLYVGIALFTAFHPLLRNCRIQETMPEGELPVAPVVTTPVVITS